ncbi:uncharacterized protein ACNS7B_012285 [Menidia menidia]
MTTQQIDDLHTQQPTRITQKVQLTYKLFLLEKARNTLEEELRNFTNKAYEEIQSFLNSSSPTSLFRDIGKAIDAKHQKVLKLSTLLKELSVESAVSNGVRKSCLEPHRAQGSLMTQTLKFGPMLQNSLIASSMAKSVQVLSQQQLKLFHSLQPPGMQRDDMLGGISPSFNSTPRNKSSVCHLNAEQVAFEEGSQPNSVCIPLVISQTHKVDNEKPQILLPPIQPVYPEIRNPKPLLIWGCSDDQVQHQKQTSSQLLHFLKGKATNKGALEAEWANSKHEACNPGLPRQISPPVKTQSRDVMTDNLINARASKRLHANGESQSPVFRVKQVKSSRSLIYTCVIATETELWDIGDISTEAREDSLQIPLKADVCQNGLALMENSCRNLYQKTQILQSTEPEPENRPDNSQMLMHKSVNIPEFQIRRFEETEVVVSHIVSPGNFYIQHANSLEKLQVFGTRFEATRSDADQNCIPDIGTQVICWFPQNEQWCRSQVMKICGVSTDNKAEDGSESDSSIKVEVKRLDYGDIFCVSIRNIKEFPPEMAVVPLQALQVSLANVRPIDGRLWSEQAVSWFKEMVHNRTLYARLYPQGPTVSVELFLEKGKLGAMRRGASLSLRLAQNGHARHDKLKTAGLIKRSAVRSQKQESDWEKHLILCYAQNKK